MPENASKGEIFQAKDVCHSTIFLLYITVYCIEYHSSSLLLDVSTDLNLGRKW